MPAARPHRILASLSEIAIPSLFHEFYVFSADTIAHFTQTNAPLSQNPYVVIGGLMNKPFNKDGRLITE